MTHDATASVGRADLAAHRDPVMEAGNSRTAVPKASGSVHALVVEHVHVAFAMFVGVRHPREQLVRNDRDVPCTPEVPLVVGPELHLPIAMTVAGGLLGDEADDAADRVLAEQSALGAAQDLDTVQIQEVENRSLGPSQVDTVHIDRHTGLE